MLYYGFIVIEGDEKEFTYKIDPSNFKPLYIDGIIKDDNGEVWGYKVLNEYNFVMNIDKKVFEDFNRHNLIDKDSLDGLNKGTYGKKKYQTYFNMPRENWNLPVYKITQNGGISVRITRLYSDELNTATNADNNEVIENKNNIDNKLLPTELTVSAPYIKSMLAQLYPKYSIKDIAKQCGVSSNTVSRWLKQYELK